MSFDYESLVGQLYIVSGRALSVPPPGALVEVAPKKAARGREADTFFTLVLPSGDVVAPTRFYEGMAQLAADRYFASGGSVTAGLRSVFDTLNQNLVEHNQQSKRHYEASMLCAVLKGSDLYVAKVGSGVVLLLHENEMLTFPENLSDDDAVYRAPLGIHPMPDVRMSRYTIGGGSRMLLADASLADVEHEKLTRALAGKSSIEPVTAPTAAAGETAAISSTPTADIGMALVALKELLLTSLKANVTALGVEFVPPETPVPLNVREGESTRTLATTKTSEMPAVKLDPQKRRSEQLNKAVDKLKEDAKSTLGAAALKTADSMDNAQKVFTHYFPEPDEQRKSLFSSPLAAAAVVLIPLLVVGLVVVMWLGGTDQSEFDLCVNEALRGSNVARGIVSTDRTGMRAAWNAVLLQIEHCNTLRPGGDATLNALRREGQTIIDALDQVDRREGIVIASFQGATLSTIVLQGLDLYALDNANNLVYRVQLNSDGRSAVPNSLTPISDMRQGAAVSGIQVGDIIDIAWAEDAGGSSSGRVITAVDRNGTIVSCPARFLLQCTATRLLGVENWSNPVAIVIWQGRLYVLDTGASQIWRYDPSGGVYASPASEYFSGQSRPPMQLAIDFDIDSNGAVYMLLSDGTVMRFRRGEREDFGFAAFPDGQNFTTANAMFLNPNPMANVLFIVNASTRTVYETSLAGTFFHSYRTFDESQFAALSSVVADTSLGMIYLASGNTIFGIVRDQ
ncbi:MAG: hypothetical protein HXY40_00905 [Chloroflexi bacterium]|nr:hypothetical protein [Chloroflexota bacterium]